MSTSLSPQQIEIRKQELYEQKLKLVSEKRRILTEKDFKLFCKVYVKGLATHTRPAFHDEMMSLLQKSPDESGLSRLLFIAPRGFAKSTVCSIFFPLWLALHGKKKDIFLVSATISLSRELLRKIRNELENNPYFLYDYGEMKSQKWTEEHLELRNGATIRAKGRGFQIRGFRPDMIVCDDLEDEEVIYSKDQRDKLEQWYFRTLLPSLKPGQSLIYVGTKLHQFSLINKLQKKEEFVTRFYKALVTDQDSHTQKSIWPELWPLERLLQLKKELGTYAFEAEYQNNPISLEEQPIKPHMIEGVRINGSVDLTCLALDPAISEKTSADYTALALFERVTDPQGRPLGFREKFSERGHWGVEETCTRIINLYEQGKFDRLIIEEVAFQKVVRQVLVKMSRERKMFIPVSEAPLGTGTDKRPRDKYTRLMGIVHLFEQRLVELRSPDLIEEALAFPHGEHDDMVDAMVYSLAWVADRRKGFVGERKQSVDGLGVPTRESFYLHEARPGVYEARHDDLRPRVPQSVKVINFDKGSM